MPNYREMRGNVGLYQDTPVVVISNADLHDLEPNTIYCIADKDPFRPNTSTSSYMNCYAVAEGQSGKIYYIGTMTNTGKIHIIKDSVEHISFPLDSPCTCSENPLPAATALNFADYTKVVDDYFTALGI